MKPKIRIIHIFAPEIIKTDVANFRELVQRLTGKPTDEHTKNNMSCTKKKLPRLLIPGNKNEASRNISTSSFPYHHHHQLIHKPLAKKMGFHYSEFIGERIKGEEEIWRGANSGGGFLGGFAELEGFMEQLNHEFPNTTMPMEISHMDGYGQSQLA
ncbi:hypothetical protein ACH5RR_002638 [Cinchona calisaya]|uniref:VQ domain-containing protein n=1 Tax=Cinchona calisaya TaxID=153742 RepID=A0ABD3AT53_9GENT